MVFMCAGYEGKQAAAAAAAYIKPQTDAPGGRGAARASGPGSPGAAF